MEFTKKIKDNEVAQKILNFKNGLNYNQKLSQIANEILTGEPKFLIGRLLKKEKMGRSMI